MRCAVEMLKLTKLHIIALLSRLWIRALGFSSPLCMGSSGPHITSVFLRPYHSVESKIIEDHLEDYSKTAHRLWTICASTVTDHLGIV